MAVSPFLHPGLLKGILFMILWGLIVLTIRSRLNTHTSEDSQRHLQEENYINLEPKDKNFEKHGPIIDLADRFTKIFHWGGYFFNETGIYKEIIAEVSTALVHSFSPYVEERVAKKFVDPPKQNVYFANSPALKWYNGSFVLVCRIWLDKERYKKDEFPLNDFDDNYLYTQRFDEKLRPLTVGRLIAIPLNNEAKLGDGPLEPRLHLVNNRLFVTFNAAILFPWMQKIDWTMIYDYDQDLTYVPEIVGGSSALMESVRGVPRDKHWMALIKNDELHFVHNLDPLNVMKCTTEGHCYFIHQDKLEEQFIYHIQPYIGHLRGGTPFEHYDGSYHISIAHNTLIKSLTHNRYYSTHLVVLCDDPYRVVYVSDDIKIDERVFEKAPQVRQMIDENFAFPVSLHIETMDSLILGVHINDHSSVLIRIRGMEQLMDAIIKLDRARIPGSNVAPPGLIRDHVRDVVIKQTGIDMLDN